MKRKQFLVSVGNSSWIKYTWNSAIRSIEANIKERAELLNTEYVLNGSESFRENCDTFNHGVRVWYSDALGETRKYTIQRVY